MNVAPDLFGHAPQPPFGLLVRLVGRHDHHHADCHDLAEILPGRGPHVAALQCLTCGKHRGWLAIKEFNFINALVARHGPPTEAIVLRNWPNGDDEMAKQYDNSNAGALFKNSEKENENHPDYRGSINVAGVEFWISGWLKTSKKGLKFMSLAVKPKNEAAESKPDYDDEIPF
jgi:hypothetical protein